MGGWQPIETAPQDGSEVDLWVVGHDGEGWRATDFAWTGTNWGHRGDPRDGLDEYFLGGPVMATHWMPKPESPDATGDRPAPMSGEGE